MEPNGRAGGMIPGWTRPAIPIQFALVASHVATLALPLGVLVLTGAWSHDLLHQRQEELSRQAALVAMMLEGQWRAAHALPDAHAGDILPEGEEFGPPGGEHAVGLPDRIRVAPEAGPDPLLATMAPGMTPTLVRVFHATHAGVRVLDRTGRVIATSGPRLGESLGDRAEVVAALAGEASVGARTELPPVLVDPRADERKTVPLTWASATVPLAPQGDIVGAVVVTRPTRGVTDALRDMRHDLGRGGAAALVLTVGLALGFGWRISRSLRGLSAVTHDLAEGRGWGIGPDEPAARGALRALQRTRVAEVRALAGAFERLVERLEARLRDNQEFAGNVSHEFKTPLATLRGTVDLLAEDAEMPPEQRARFLENARFDLDRLDRMVSGLLELARAEAAQNRERLEMDEILDTISERYPDIEVIRGGGEVVADYAQLELAVANLVENARLHGGPPIRVKGWAEAERVGVDVEDHGPGVSPANQPRVFERFFTTSADRRGTGLGLPLVRAVARVHAGDVTLDSRPGHTRFRLWLPRASGEEG